MTAKPLTESYSSGPTDQPLIETTIPVNLRETVEKFGDREALVDKESGKRWTYREFWEDVRKLATGLHKAGIRRGDGVGIWANNRWEWTLTQFATSEIGAVLVTINPSYRQHELNFALRQSQIKGIIVSEKTNLADYPAMMNKALREQVTLDLIVTMNTESWQEIANTEADHELLDSIVDTLDPHDPINIQYTSGTTGFPKGATLTHRNILNNGFFVGERIRYTEQDRICIPVPFYHCFGMVMGNLAATSHGAAMIIPGQSYDPAVVLRTVEEEQCTSLYGVPTMFIAELNLPNFSDFDLSTLRTGIMAGSPCPAEIMKRVVNEMNMEEVSICYGMTETSPVSVQTKPDDELHYRVSTVGQVGPHLEVKIVDTETGDTQPIGVDGELCTRGYSVMKGYWREPGKTAEVLTKDGWMHTGDLGVMDENGYIKVTGRAKDMVIRGGENVYPVEIEEFLYTHPDIIDAQVIGVPDEKYGEELMAWIRVRDGKTITAAALREFALGKLAKYKIPRYVHIVDEFPTTVTGKVRKAQMRDTASELLSSDEVDDYRASEDFKQRRRAKAAQSKL